VRADLAVDDIVSEVRRRRVNGSTKKRTMRLAAATANSHWFDACVHSQEEERKRKSQAIIEFSSQ